MIFTPTSGLFEEYVFDVKLTTYIYWDPTYGSPDFKAHLVWLDDVAPNLLGQQYLFSTTCGYVGVYMDYAEFQYSSSVLISSGACNLET